jgi:hypothetical protein
MQSREVYDRKLAGVKQTVWEDRDLPFRVTLDLPDPELAEAQSAIGQGVTCKLWHEFCSTAVPIPAVDIRLGGALAVEQL